MFHIHQLDFLVQSVNDQDPDATGLRDVIDLPYARNGKPGMAKVKIPFTNPLIVGRFPYRCHILEHEDHGMMATVRVLPKGSATPSLGKKEGRQRRQDGNQIRPRRIILLLGRTSDVRINSR